VAPPPGLETVDGRLAWTAGVRIKGLDLRSPRICERIVYQLRRSGVRQASRTPWTSDLT
jgi:hypothetical protein